MRQFEYHAPHNLQEAIGLLQQHGNAARPLAGGTDLVVQMKESATRFPFPSHVVSLLRVPELKGIEFSESSGLRIGAATTMAEVAESPIIRERFPAIAEGASVVGSYQTMNMATVGGNLCNAAPSADIAPSLVAFDSDVVIVGPGGQRSLPLTEFFTGPGQTAITTGELLTEVHVPTTPARTGSAYTRHTPRKQMDIAVVGVAVMITLGDGDRIDSARIALGAVAPTPIRSPQAEAELQGQAVSDDLFARVAEVASAVAQPISDIRGSADFRRHLVRVMTDRMLHAAAERAR